MFQVLGVFFFLSLLGSYAKADCSPSKGNANSALMPCGFVQSDDIAGSTLLGADLTEANMAFQTFKNKKFYRIKMFKADLQQSNFVNSNLEEADLRQAQLKGAMFREAELKNVQFEDANLMGVRFYGVTLENVKFTNADMRDVRFDFCRFKGVKFSPVQSARLTCNGCVFLDK